ncbi:MAG: hypothetical protein IT324_29650 [Anaerolineae bacterium]|nr:hypothetical protein [Anaerolineae bacterium]
MLMILGLTCRLILESDILEAAEVRVGKAFLSQLLNQNQAAEGYLSRAIAAEVKLRCSMGKLSGCITRDPAWGNLKEIRFVYGSLDAYLFYIWWTNIQDPIAVVVLVKKENDQLVVVGWRGFIVVQNNNEISKLLNGTRHDNEFP